MGFATGKSIGILLCRRAQQLSITAIEILDTQISIRIIVNNIWTRLSRILENHLFEWQQLGQVYVPLMKMHNVEPFLFLVIYLGEKNFGLCSPRKLIITLSTHLLRHFDVDLTNVRTECASR